MKGKLSALVAEEENEQKEDSILLVNHFQRLGALMLARSLNLRVLCM